MSKSGGMKRKSCGAGESSGLKKLKMTVENDLDSIVEKVFGNGHLIREIFKHLPMEDLAVVARVSYGMKINASAVFKTVHDASVQLVYRPENFSRQQMTFRQFGNLIKKLSVDMMNADYIFHEDGDKVLRTVGHFCGTNLKDLTLRGMTIDLSSPDFDNGNDRAEILNVLGTLTKVTLFNVCVKSRLFKWIPSVEELMIHSSCHMETRPEVTTLRQLRILSISACPSWPFIAGVSVNLRRNRSIEQVDYHFIVSGNGYLESICSLPNLTHLKLIVLNSDHEELSFIANARNLEEVSIHVPASELRNFSELQQMLPNGWGLTLEPLLERKHDDHDQGHESSSSVFSALQNCLSTEDIIHGILFIEK